MIETKIHIVWDELGHVACHTDADEAANLLESESTGRFRRVLALDLTLPPATAIKLSVVADDDLLRPQLQARR